ncbi:MAG: NAD(P)/FAD-dependent oxidoreductase [Deltaproteobacteria bacterium]|nr:NAD(P)/FAD-dependent oxidoreductase [Deltaproteobacteria bacterium]
MADVDVTVVGAGVVGLAVARELVSSGRSVFLVEQHDRVGQETSSRNSEVIHAGLYYEPGSLKATLCVEGSRLILAFCRDRSIPYRQVGKLVVATESSQVDHLEWLYRNATDCGATNLEMLDAEGIRKLEPAVAGLTALHSPLSAVVDTWELMQAYKTEFFAQGGHLVLRARVTDLDGDDPDGWRVVVTRPDGQQESFTSTLLVNSAGLAADRILELAGLGPDALGLRLHFWKGRYFAVRPSFARRINGLLYPVPGNLSGGLGVHFTPDVTGRVRLGPDAVYVGQAYPPDYDVGDDPDLHDAFWKSGRSLVADLERSDIQPDSSGIRARLYAPGDSVRDFEIRIQTRARSAAVHLLGIESPGLTASPAIARQVRRSLDDLA